MCFTFNIFSFLLSFLPSFLPFSVTSAHANFECIELFFPSVPTINNILPFLSLFPSHLLHLPLLLRPSRLELFFFYPFSFVPHLTNFCLPSPLPSPPPSSPQVACCRPPFHELPHWRFGPLNAVVILEAGFCTCFARVDADDGHDNEYGDDDDDDNEDDGDHDGDGDGDDEDYVTGQMTKKLTEG